MYAARVGAMRAQGLSPFADLAGAGVPLAFGSDAPVTRIDPWAGVLAAMSHVDPDQQISARAAFRAHTRGGWRIAGLDHTGAGQLRVGAPAHLAVWRGSTSWCRVRWAARRRRGARTRARGSRCCPSSARTCRDRGACRPCVPECPCSTRSSDRSRLTGR